MAVLAWATFAPSASASMIGHLSVANCSAGGIQVSTAAVVWLPDPSSVGFACLQVSVATNLVSNVSGALEEVLPGFAGTGIIKDLPAGLNGFMTLSGDTLTKGPLLFTLTSLGPGIGPTPVCLGLPIGQSCSVSATSQFILTATSTGTSVTLLAGGTVVDPSVPASLSSNWNGAFTSQITGQTPAQIQATILGGGAITSSFSGEFNVGVPEPVSMVLIGGGLIALAVIKRRKLV